MRDILKILWPNPLFFLNIRVLRNRLLLISDLVTHKTNLKEVTIITKYGLP